MCGIAGIWERGGKPVERSMLERMAAVLHHRGPDGEGVYLGGEMGMAHRRLAIVDLSDDGHQPIATPDRALWLNFNGEIHNFVELRRELEERGVNFRSRSDTEVVLWAYRVWGADCFRRFNGMWALALWDAAKRELILSRDRFGIKPLCYSVRGKRVAFASEPKAILEVFPEERAPSHREIYAHLAGAYPDGGETTFFANLAVLPPATYAVFRSGGMRRESYWHFVPGEEAPRADAEEHFRHLLRDSVRLRMRSDVPVGVTLSGGLDSTAVARLAEPVGDPLHCFSLKYDDPRVDESRYAALAADDARFRMHWVRPDPRGLLDTMTRITWHHDAPMPPRGRVPQWFVMQEAGRHVKVVLEGHGSDELLAGYPHFILPYLLDRLRFRTPETASMGIRAELEALTRIYGSGRAFPLRLMANPFKRWIGLDQLPWKRVVRREYADAHGPVPSAGHREVWMRRDVDRPFRSHLNNALWLELRRAGLPESLHADDALSMAFSVESRPPFLDHRVVEFCFSLPFHEKMREGWSKSLLRRSLADVLPPEIRDRRRKLGFPAPLARWLREEANFRDVADLLLSPRCTERGIFDRARLERGLERFRTADPTRARNRTSDLWRWLTLELWFRDFIDGGTPSVRSARAAPAAPATVVA
ncbi:MAG: asparagine synthase (glutamine-hydrolyzing) [Longimicrobiaceae bacterium]